MPGLIRGVARTAVIAGTATAVSNRVSRRQAGRWATQAPSAYANAAPQAYESQAYAPADSAAEMDYKLAQLSKLGELKQQGLLNEAEFEMQKARILDS
jgi:Short C-terminal domain